MRILYVTPRQCWPTTSGAKLRAFYFLKSLAKYATVDLLGFSEGKDVDVGLRELNAHSAAKLIDMPRRYSPAKIVRSVFSAVPLPVINYASGEMSAEVERLLSENRYDAIHLDGVHTGHYYEIASRLNPSIPAFFNWHNIESELLERYSENAPLGRAAFARVTAARLKAFEDVLLRNAGGHFVCSEREKELLLERAPRARVAVIENGVDCSYFAAAPRSESAQRLVFVGSMNYHANIEAVRYFANAVWPSVRQKYPALKFTIVGSNPSPAVLQLKEIEGVEVTGTVADVRPYYSDAYAAIVPLLTGGGTRLKILEAMAAGVPVVTTALGCEGLETEDSVHLLKAETAAEWIAAMDRLANPSVRAAIIAAAGELVRSRYDWPVIGDALWSAYADWLTPRADQR